MKERELGSAQKTLINKTATKRFNTKTLDFISKMDRFYADIGRGKEK